MKLSPLFLMLSTIVSFSAGLVGPPLGNPGVQPATQNEVDAGTVTDKYVSPKTLSDSSIRGGGISLVQSSNMTAAIIANSNNYNGTFAGDGRGVTNLNTQAFNLQSLPIGTVSAFLGVSADQVMLGTTLDGSLSISNELTVGTNLTVGGNLGVWGRAIAYTGLDVGTDITVGGYTIANAAGRVLAQDSMRSPAFGSAVDDASGQDGGGGFRLTTVDTVVATDGDAASQLVWSGPITGGYITEHTLRMTMFYEEDSTNCASYELHLLTRYTGGSPLVKLRCITNWENFGGKSAFWQVYSNTTLVWIRATDNGVARLYTSVFDEKYYHAGTSGDY